MTRLVGISTLAFVVAIPAVSRAQGTAASEANPRTATTTVSGATGIWFVPTAEVLASRKWSASFYRTNLDEGQGFADVSTFPVTAAVGLGGRAELFGSFASIVRIDRDTRPLFFAATPGQPSAGGILVNYPLNRTAWTGNKVGDLRVGAKVNLMSSSAKPMAAAVRASIKLPTGDDTAGTTSGVTDLQLDGIFSTYSALAEVSGYAGVLVRGNPEGYKLTNGLRWGVGASLPQRYSLGLRFTAELIGEQYFNKTITAPAGQLGADGSAVPTSTTLRNSVVTALGVTWVAPNGFFIGGAGSWNLTMKERQDSGFPNTSKDDKGFQVRIGFHPGARNRTPGMFGGAGERQARGGAPSPAGAGTGTDRSGRAGNGAGGAGNGAGQAGNGPGAGAGAGQAGAGAGQAGAAGPGAGGSTAAGAPGAGAPGAGAPGAGAGGPASAGAGVAGNAPGSAGAGSAVPGNQAANRPPTVRASCNPCTVEVGRTATVAADAQDPDGDALTYQWTTAAGSLGAPTARQSAFTAPAQAGPVPVTVVVNDGKGGTARDTTTLQVTAAAPKQYSFEDVHFEFDRFTLRPDAIRLLDDAVTAMRADPSLRLQIEGHTCNIGTAEYNLALGERRALAVRDYLTSRGVNAERLSTVSYGEERPKHDNSREDTRRLNRRAALVVRLQ